MWIHKHDQMKIFLKSIKLQSLPPNSHYFFMVELLSCIVQSLTHLIVIFSLQMLPINAKCILLQYFILKKRIILNIFQSKEKNKKKKKKSSFDKSKMRRNQSKDGLKEALLNKTFLFAIRSIFTNCI